MSVISHHPERLGDRYEVLSVLGSGGMADVYLAHDTELDRQVAVKVLRDAGGSSRFRAEARTLARLRHPSLVAVLDVGELADRPYIVLELVDGSTLAERCRDGRLPLPEVARIGEQVAAALTYVHGEGVVHRDVCPGNVLLSKDGRAHLADFGIARMVVDAPTMTAAGETLGTAPYLAPEQLRGEEPTGAVDVYALGLSLLEAATGERAYPGPASQAAMARLQRGPGIPDWLPATWRELLQGMTAAEPRDRPSAAAVQAALARIADVGDGTRVLPVSEPARATPRMEHLVVDARTALRRVPLAALVGLALVVLLLLVLLVQGGGSDPTPPSVPRGVPSGVADELQDLHDAVAGR